MKKTELWGSVRWGGGRARVLPKAYGCGRPLQTLMGLRGGVGLGDSELPV